MRDPKRYTPPGFVSRARPAISLRVSFPFALVVYLYLYFITL